MQLINCEQDAYLIDVREPDEVIQGSIPSAVNLPLSVLANSLHLDPVKFKQTHGFEKPKKDQEVTFYCRSGVRSSTASDVAKRNGYTKCVPAILCVRSIAVTDLHSCLAYRIIKDPGWTGWSKTRALLECMPVQCGLICNTQCAFRLLFHDCKVIPSAVARYLPPEIFAIAHVSVR